MKKTEKKGLDLLTAYKIMGKLIIGIDGIDRFLGFIPKNLHSILFTERELDIHANEGHMLYLEVSRRNGQPLNIEALAKIACCKNGNQIGPNEYLFWSQQFNDDGSVKSEAWFYNDPIVMNATPRFGWNIASEEVIPETLGINYIDQTDALIDYHKKLYKRHLPEHYKEAIAQWEAKRPMLEEILYTDKAAKEIAKCDIISLTGESFVSSEYRRLLIYENEGRKILQRHWNWSNTRTSDGKFVGVGYFGDVGASMFGNSPVIRDGDIGVSFSRSL